MKTKVIFRKFSDNDIIALFPEQVPPPVRGVTCDTYMHIGQHYMGDYKYLINETKPANISEYTYLQKELEDIGYDLDIVKTSSSES